MPQQLEIKLTLPATEKLYSSWGSILQGALMEQLPSNFVTAMHEQGLRSYASYAFFSKERQQAIWRLSTLDDASTAVIMPVLNNLESLQLKKHNCTVGLTVQQMKSDSYTELTDKLFLASQPPKGVMLNFITATSFKRNGQYVNFPDLFLILNSLLKRWQTFSPDIKLDEVGLAAKLSDMCQIESYQLHSQNFSLEGQVIHGFAGSMKIHFWAADTQRRILGLLFSFANYAGVGIKTALGMGGTTSELYY